MQHVVIFSASVTKRCATRVLQGGNDEEILDWCFETGRALNEGDLLVWNSSLSKLGWTDFPRLCLND